MADCGATGSTLDRAAAVLAGNGNTRNSASKNIAGFLGHASMGSSVAAMPAAPPTALATPSSMTAAAASQRHAASPRPPMDAAWQQQQSQWNQQPVMQQHHPMMHPHYGMMARQQQQHQMYHQQQQMQQLQMHHQQMVMAQQMQHHQAAMKQEAAMKQQQQQQQSNTESVKQKNVDNWHEGLEQQVERELETFVGSDLDGDLQARLQGQQHDDDVATVGHEGIVHGASIQELGEAWQQVKHEEEDGHEGLAQGATIEDLAKAWAQAEADYQKEDPSSNLWAGAEEHVQQQVHEYEFSQASREHPKEDRDWMAEGMRQFDEGMTLEAITSFETLLRHVDGDNATAWFMLGKCHAENDEDRKAIACLEQAVERDPYSTEALLALGVSYVNELNHERALENLKSWITHNPSYAGMEFISQAETPLEEVQHLLRQALEFDATAEVYEALGVVYNVSRDYDAAVQSFQQALELNPDNYQLYNKLGATLANSNQSDLALDQYEQALQIKPRYARAWLNMAISHSNQSHYQDAARCYLQTLSLNPSAIHCWSYLRIALSCLEEWDLIPFCASQNLEAFREHYDFV